MKNSIYKTILCSSVAVATFAITSVPTFAQSPLGEKEAAVRINAANGLLRDGKVDDAIAAYREVVPDDQQKNKLNYNLAVAEYRKGNIDSAQQLFNEVAGSGDANISSDSRYNLGNCQYAKAVELGSKDTPAAIELLRQAIANYRGSLKGNPNNPDARANIELAGELIRKLEAEQKQEDQQKQDQQQNDDQKQDEEQNQDQQQQDKQQDKNKEDQQQDKKDQSEQQQSDQQHKEDEQKNQQDKSEKSESQQSDSKQGESKEEKSQEDSNHQKSESQDSKSDNKSDEQKKQDEASASDQQNQDQQKQDEQKNGKPEEQEAKHQQVPGGELKTAGKQDENKNADRSVAIADPNPKDGLMTRVEALKMLQAVRDRDMLRRMQQQRQERSRHVTVDRDW